MDAAALLIVAAALGLAGIWGLARLAAARRPWSDEEYERRRSAPGSGLLAAAMKAVGTELGPGGRRAVEERQSFENGGYEEAQAADEPPAPPLDGRAEPGSRLSPRRSPSQRPRPSARGRGRRRGT